MIYLCAKFYLNLFSRREEVLDRVIIKKSEKRVVRERVDKSGSEWVNKNEYNINVFYILIWTAWNTKQLLQFYLVQD